MNKRDYGFYEDYILNKHMGAIDKVKSNLGSLNQEKPQETIITPKIVSQYGDSPFVGLNGTNDFSNSQGMGSQERQLSRIRTMDSSSVVKPVVEEAKQPESFEYGNVGSYEQYNHISSNQGSSFVLVLAAVIALIAMVLVVSFGIISKIGL